jgi:DNA-binding MarR family transcriptional regulator
MRARAGARTTDRDSSHIAADRAEASGVVAKDARATLKAVSLFPGCTTRELSAHTGLAVHMLGRRLADLQGEGWIRPRIESAGHGRALRSWTTTRGESLAAEIPLEELENRRQRTPREERLFGYLQAAHAQLDDLKVPRTDGIKPLGLRRRILLLAKRSQR